jgi:gliding motility-associated-like protein
MKNNIPTSIIRLFTVLLLINLWAITVKAQCPTSSSVSSTPVSCKGGSDGTLTATYVGAVAPSSFQLWQFDGALIPVIGSIPVITNSGYTATYSGLPALSAGSVYFVSANFPGCALGPRFTFPIAIAEPSADVDVTVTSQTNVTGCFGDATGSITVNATGGNGGYQYSINGSPLSATNTFTNLTAGTYGIQAVDSKGCTDNIVVVITQPTQLTATTTNVNPSCNGFTDGTITVNASGGTPSYTYSLNGGAFQSGNSFTGLAPGTYTIQVKDANNCTLASPINITLTQPPVLTISLTSKTDIANCFGDATGQIVVGVSGGNSGYTYSINSGAFQAGTGNSFTFNSLTAGSYSIVVKDSRNCTATLATVTITQPPQLTITLNSQTNILCNGGNNGSITITSAGGTPSYEYSVNGAAFAPGNANQTFSNLTAGTYSIIVRDAKGCTQTLPTVTLTQPPVLAISLASSQNISCNAGNDGNIVASVTGGVLPYQFSINGGAFSTGSPSQVFSNLVAGTYNIVVKDANNCTATLPAVTLTEPPLLAISLVSKTDILNCFGDATGSITVNTAGGTSGYEYSVNGGTFTAGSANQTFSNLTAGTYSIIVRDAKGCTQTLPTVTLTQPPVLAISLASQTNISCNAGNDGSITVNISGGTAGYQYSVNGGAFTAVSATPLVLNNLTAGTYNIIIRDSKGCSQTLPTVTLTQPTVLAISLTSSQNVSCNGGSDGQIVTSVSGGTSPYQYSVNGGSFASGSGTFTGLTAGTYNIIVRDANGCTQTLPTVTLTQPTVLAISLSSKTDIANCFGDATGQIVTSVTGGTSPYQYSVNGSAFASGSGTFTGLTAGTYNIIVQDAKGCTATLATVTITQPPQLTITLNSQTDIDCNGGNTGSITVNTAGGTSGYEYSVNGGTFTAGSANQTFSNLTAGTYSIIVRDAKGCTQTLPTVTLTQPPVLAISLASQTNISCNAGNDGSITVNISGGTAGYQYSVNGGAFTAVSATPLVLNNLTAGTYNIIIRDSKGCSQTLPTVTLTQPTVLAISLTSSQNVSCNGGSDGQIVTSVSGGTSPYQYSVNGSAFTSGSGTFTGLTAGTYSIVVKDANGCTQTLPTVTLTQPAAITFSLSSQTNITGCFGDATGQIVTSVTGGTSPYQYSVNGGAFASGSGTFTGLTAGTYNIIVRDANGCTQTLPTVTLTQPAQLTASVASSQNVSCNTGSDGSITVNISGGTTAYQYSINGGTFNTIAISPLVINGLTAGTYSIVVRDASSCSVTLPTVTLTQPTALAISLTSSQNVTCNGGTDGNITVNVTGGTSGYDYSINGSSFTAGTPTQAFSNLTAGTYNIVVRDSKGCTTALSPVVLTQPTALVITLTSSQNPACSGQTNGQIVVNVSGGTPNYDFSINGGAFVAGSATETFSNLTAGTYNITVRDSKGCTQSLAPVTLTQPTAITFSLTSQTNILCNGASTGQIVTSVSGGTSPYQYSVNGGAFASGSGTFTGLTAGTYNIIVRDANGCTQTLPTVTLTEPTVLNISLISSQNISCNGATDGSITVSTSGGTTGYQYSVNGGSFTAGTATQTFSNLAAGTYNIVVRDANGCTQTLAPVTLTQPTALIASVTASQNVSCGGGNDGSITVNISGGTAGYQYSVNGGTFTAVSATPLVLSNLTAGTYNIIIRDANNCSQTLTPISLTQPTAITFSLTSSQNLSCNGANDGQIVTSVTGGTSPYQYSVNGGSFASGSGTFTGLAAGTYSIVVRDANGCTQTLPTVTLTQPTAITFTLTSSQNITCNGTNDGRIVTSVSGGTSPYQYSVNGGSFASGSGTFTGLTAGTYSIVVKDANGCTSTLPTITITEPTVLAISLTSSQNVSCNGGSDGQIITSVSGGTSPYQYSVNGGAFASGSGTFTGLTAGTYNIIVRDANNCTQTLPTVTLTQPTAITFSLTSQTNILCNGASTGQIVTSVSGGVSPYQYSVNGSAFASGSGTFTGLTAGTYNIIVRDANGCTQTLPAVTITQPVALTISLTSSQNISCNGANDGQIVTSVSGGVSPYQYSVNGSAFASGSGTFTGLASGNYVIQVQDANGCVSTLPSVNITEPAVLAITLVSQTDVTGCFGNNNGSITVNVTGGTSGYDYSINGGSFTAGTPTQVFSNLTAGTYNIVVRDSKGCLQTLPTVTIAQPAGMTISLVSQTNLTCGGGSDGQIVVNVTGGTSPYQYSVNGGTFTSGTATQTFTNLTGGTYSIVVKDANGCTQTLPTVTLTQPANLSISVSSQSNPKCNGSADGQITVSGSGGTAPYLFSFNGGAFAATNSFTGLVAGNYDIVIQDSKGCTTTLPTITLTQPAVLDITVSSKTDINVCAGITSGTINVAATGGTTAYQYSINGGIFAVSSTFSGLTAGNYTIRVQDANGCIASVSTTISTIPSNLTATVTPTDVTCNGGNNGQIIITNVLGGGGTYEYSLNGGTFQTNNTFTGLTAGSYSIQIRDLASPGCTVTLNTTISQPAASLAIALTSQTDVTGCFGNSNGQIVVNVTGGTSPYQYSVNGSSFASGSGTFAGLTAGTYNITVQDAKGCTAVLPTVTLTQPTKVTATLTSKTDVDGCFGDTNGSITVSATGGTSVYQFSLNGGAFQASGTFTSLAAGTYQVVARDGNSCTDTLKNIVIAQPAALTITLASQTDLTCDPNSKGSFSVTVSGGTPAYQYSLNGGAFASGTGTFSNLSAGTYNVTVRDTKGCTQTLSNIVITSPGAITSTGNATSPTTCNATDGQITITSVTGGSGSYVYSLDGTNYQLGTTFSNLTNGVYTVYIRDVVKGCTVTVPFVLISPSAVNATVTPTNATCAGNNGQIVITNPTGGSGSGYQYSLDGVNFQTSNTFTGLSAGNYKVRIKDSGSCQTSVDVAISAPAALQATVTGTNLTDCSSANGSITVSGLSGGSGTYEFSIDGVNFQSGASFTGLSAGIYTITIRDAANTSCLITKTQTLTAPNAITATLASQNISCKAGTDGQITVQNATGGSGTFEYSKDGVTFQSSAVFTGLTAGSYNIVVRDVNNITCKITLSITLTEPTALVSVVTSSTNPGCVSNNGSITVTTSGGTTGYEYSVNGGTFTAGTATQVFSNLAAGTYNVQVRDSKGCIVTLSTVTLTAPAAITATITPTGETVCNANDGKISVTGVTGTAPYQYFINGNPNPAGINNSNFTGLAPGTYTITVTDANGCSFTQSVDVTRNCPCNITATATIVPVICSGTSNGQAFLLNVQGGSGSYEYNINGGTYQPTANFTNLAIGNYTIGVRDKNNVTCTASFPVTVVAQFQVSAIIIVNQPKTCNDKGSIEFTNVNGGTAPYQFSIDGTTFSTTTLYTGLNPGTYPATIKDANSCTLAVNINIIGIPAINATVTNTNVSCFGGSNGTITISNVAGGSGTYIYSLDGTNFSGNTSFSGLKAGSYTAYIKDQSGNCVSQFPVTITEPAKIVTTSSSTQPTTCSAKDGQIQLSTTVGNVAPVTYSLNGGSFQSGATFTGLGSGIYTLVTRNGNGCTDTLKVTLSAPNSITATPGIVTQVSCNGSKDGSIQLTAVSGGSGTYEYSIDGTTFQTSALFSGLGGGVYTITVRDKGITSPCLSTYSIALTQPQAITATVSGTNPTSCTAKDGTITIANIAGGTAPYQVSLDSLINYQTALTFSGLGNQNYKVYIKDSKGCITVYNQNLVNTGGVTAGTPVLKQPACKGDKNGQIQMQNVAGGTAPYQYSLDDINYQNTGNFNGLGAGAYTVYVKDATGCKYPFKYTLTDPAGINFTIAVLDSAKCGAKSGKIEVRNVTGGISPYLFSLDNVKFQSANSWDTLSAGSYTLYIRDNSASTCINSQAFTVPGTPPVTYKIDSVSIGCTGTVGKIVIYQIKGGIKPYKVSLDGGNTVSFVANDSIAFNNLAAGSYKFVLEFGNGCKTPVRTINITAGNVPFSVATTAATCGGDNGRATVQIANAQNYFFSIDSVNYVKSTVFDKLKPGKYTMFVRQTANDPCVNKFPFIISGPDSIKANIVRTDCDKILLTAMRGGTQPYKISLDGGTTFVSSNLFSNTFTTASLQNNTEYQVVIEDVNGCRSAITRIKVENNIKAVISTEETLSTESSGVLSVLDIRGGLAPYQVSIDGGKTYGLVKDTSTPIDTVYTKLPAGTYPVIIKDAAGCTKLYDVVIKERDFFIPNTFTPNGDGVNDKFEMVFKDSYLPPDNTKITVYNRWGKQVYHSNNYKNDWTGDTNPDGTYYYEVYIPILGKYSGWILIWRGPDGGN